MTPKQRLLLDFMNGLWTGTASEFCTADATFNPPGAPPMPINIMEGMCMTMKDQAFPEWESKLVSVVENADGSCTVGTQQCAGRMMGDLPAMGPFPEVKLAHVPPMCREVPVCWPVELGTFTFSADGAKIASGSYAGKTVDAGAAAAPVTPWVAQRWNKKGDLSDTGFGLLFEMMGVKLPPPPASETEEKSASAASDAPPCFYAVVHEWKAADSAAKFWQMMSSMGPAEYAALGKKNNAAGYHNHVFMPTKDDGLVLCLWECEDAQTSPESFQQFIDGPDGPGAGQIFKNTCYKAMPGASLPASHFAAGCPETGFGPGAASSGSHFWVYHEFKGAEAAEGFWKWVGGLSADDWAASEAKNNGLGFHNHAFVPCDSQGPCICLWESKNQMDEDEFQKFIDGPDGPGAGEVFDNTVHKALPMASVPSAKFKAPAASA